MQNFIGGVIVGCLFGAGVGWLIGGYYALIIPLSALLGGIAGLPIPSVARWTLAGAPIGFIVNLIVAGLVWTFDPSVGAAIMSTAGTWTFIVAGVIVCGVAAANAESNGGAS